MAILWLMGLGYDTLHAATITTSGVLKQDETWQGTVLLSGDLRVPPGITLTITSGTTVAVTPQKSDHDISIQRRSGGKNQDLAHPGLVDLIIEGALRAEGGWWWWQRLRFGSASAETVSWGGVLFVGNGQVSRLRYATVQHAHTAVRCLGQAAPEISKIVLKFNVNGLEAYEQAAPRVTDSSMRANFRGIGIFDTAAPHLLRNVIRVNNQGVVIGGHASPTLEQTTVSKNTTGVLVRGEAQPLLHQTHIGKKWLGLVFRGNRRGLVIADRASPTVRDSVLSGNDLGLLLRDQAAPTLTATTISGNQTDREDRREGQP